MNILLFPQGLYFRSFTTAQTRTNNSKLRSKNRRKANRANALLASIWGQFCDLKYRFSDLNSITYLIGIKFSEIQKYGEQMPGTSSIKSVQSCSLFKSPFGKFLTAVLLTKKVVLRLRSLAPKYWSRDKVLNFKMSTETFFVFSIEINILDKKMKVKCPL